MKKFFKQKESEGNRKVQIKNREENKKKKEQKTKEQILMKK